LRGEPWRTRDKSSEFDPLCDPLESAEVGSQAREHVDHALAGGGFAYGVQMSETLGPGVSALLAFFRSR
uniref:hypothetical protein n=1 Tax=Ferrimicrobium acidiphilum TaxID=121039 RepID=UPI0023F128C0